MNRQIVWLICFTLVLAACAPNVESAAPPTSQNVAPGPTRGVPAATATTPPAAALPPEPWTQVRADWPLFASQAVVEEAQYFGAPYLYELADEEYSEEDFAQPYRLNHTVEFNTLKMAFISFGWCASDAATLAANLAQMQTTFLLNGEAIPAEFLHESDFEDPAAGVCTEWVALASDWPAGEHIVEVTYTLLAEVNDGMAAFPAGDYTDVFNISVAPQAAEFAGQTFGRQREVVAAFASNEVPPLFALGAEEYSEEDYFQPGVLTYTVELSASQPALFTAGWCATDWDTLYSNLEFLTPVLEINGQEITRAHRTAVYFDNGDSKCVISAALITAWSPGDYAARTVITVAQPIHDGEREYPAGEYADVYQITVTP